MKHTILAALLLAFGGFLFSVPPANAQVDPSVPASASTITRAATVPAPTRARVLEKYSHLPLGFEANQGQTDQRVRFLSRGSGYTLFLTPTEAVVSVTEPAGGSSDSQGQGFSLTHNRISTLRMELSGARTDAAITGSEELPGRSNYFIGNDPKQWHTRIPAFARVGYAGIYPGVDLVYYGNQRQLEYDFVVEPGADPNRIKLKVSGSHQIRIDEHGDVLLAVGDQEFRLGAPAVYQEYNGKRHPVAGRWIHPREDELQFGLGAYDHSRTLVVDPALALIYSTFIGGSGKDQANAVAVDAAGDAYITGFTASTDFPVLNAFQGQCNGCTGAGTNNAFVTAIDPTGSFLLYSTYLGGSNGDGANGITVDANHDVFVAGTTFSGGAGGIPFPTTTGAFQTTCAGGCTNGDGFVSAISPDGSSLNFSTFLGGTGTDAINAIALDFQDGVYVAGSTSSTDFPLKNPVQSTNAGGTKDAFVTKLNGSLSALDYSTYLGGTLDDEAFAVAVDTSLDTYVAGVTYSTDFPTQSPLQAANGGGGDGFVAKLNSKGSGLTYSTYLGGSALDQINGVALDTSNNVYVVGTTSSGNFPTQSPFQSTCGSCSIGPSDAFVAKITTDGSALVYSTYLGGSAAESGFSIAVDPVGNAFVSGQTSSADFPTANSNYSFGTCSSCSTGGHDAFVTEFDVAGDALIFSSYLGGTTSQAGLGITVNGTEQAIVAGGTASSNFPTTAGAEQTTYGGGAEDAFISAFPGAASCTNSYTQTGATINMSLVCNGLFFLGNEVQFMGFNWGDNSEFTGSGPGCPASTGCIVTTGTATFPAGHTYPGNGTYSGTNTVMDGDNNTVITTGFTVNIPGVSITTLSLPGGTVGTPYSQALTASGGGTPYTWSIVSGSLAPLTLNPTTGVISGTPTTASTLSFTVQVKDANGVTATQPLSIVVTSPLTITTQPASQTINSGQTATMTVVASGGTGTLTYQWYQGTSGVTTNPISGATKSSYTTPALTATTSYWVQVKDAASDSANSNTATITVIPPLLITTQPASQTINSGQTATMTVVASGGTGTLTYQWYQGTSGVTTNPISGATKSSFTTPALTATTSYWVQVKDAASDSANSNTATITVIQPLTITTQPASQSINSGQTATMTVVASGGSGTLTYQWYQGTSGVTTNPISGATQSSYTTPALTATTSYWVQVKDAASDSANSNTATITVNALGITITTQPASQTINSGQTATMTVVASGGTGTLTYQWYQGTTGVTTNPISGATKSSYTTPALTITTSYWVQVKDSASDSVNSNTATITVNAPPITITTQPASQTINSGQTATLTVVASGGTGTLTYQWYQGTSGVTTNPVSGATQSSFTTPALTATTSYWVQVKDAASGSANSNTATITVIQPLTITTQPASQTINSGQTATMTVAASGGTGALTYQWYLGSSGTTTSPISGATHASYTTPALTATASYWVQVNDTASDTVNSNTATISVVAAPTCAAPTVQSGTNSLSVTATSNCTDSASTITSTSISWGDDSAASSGTSASHTYEAGGTYTITVTATNANNLVSSASATVTVSEPVSTPVSQGEPMDATVNVVAPPGGDITVTYSCTSADGPQGTQPLSSYYLTGCSVTGPGGSSTVTLTDTPQPINVTVNTTGPTSQTATRRGRVGGLYLAFMFLPGIVLLGAGFSRPLRGKAGRFAGAVLVGLMMLSWLACGGGSIAPPPNQNVTPSGAYGINITGTSSTGTTTTITVGFTVTIG